MPQYIFKNKMLYPTDPYDVAFYIITLSKSLVWGRMKLKYVKKLTHELQ